jgi:dTDP-glucose 4,6-dehydratase
MTKRLVVTGGAGFIGSAVVRHAIAQRDCRVLVINKLTYAGNLASLAPVTGDQRHSFARADIADAPKIRELLNAFQPDVIVHLAAESHVDRSVDGPGEFIQTNVVGTYVLLQAALSYWQRLPAARKSTFRFLHVSSDEVFGSLGTAGHFNETTAYNPTSPYSASKAASDHLVRAWNRTYELPVLITNSSNNYGPYQFPEKLIPLTIINALEGMPLPVYGAGINVRDWLYVEDHVAALFSVIDHGRVGETYCVGGRADKTNLDVVTAICRLMDGLRPRDGGHEQLVQFIQDRPGHDLRYAIDSTRIRAELGWRPAETFETGLRKTVEWYLVNAPWWQHIRKKIYRGERLGVVVA